MKRNTMFAVMMLLAVCVTPTFGKTNPQERPPAYPIANAVHNVLVATGKAVVVTGKAIGKAAVATGKRTVGAARVIVHGDPRQPIIPLFPRKPVEPQPVPVKGF